MAAKRPSSKPAKNTARPIWAVNIAALPEAFPAGLHQMAGIPHLPEPIAQARELNVIGAGEGGYFGTTPVEAELPAASAEAATAQDVAKPEGLPGHEPEAAPSPVAQPVAAQPRRHQKPRPISTTVRTPDRAADLSGIRCAVAEEGHVPPLDRRIARGARRERAAPSAPHADAIAESRRADAAQQGKKGGYGKLQSLKSKRDALIEERDAYVAEHTQGDSADMAKVRQQLQEVDYRQRDLAPAVTKAYRDAQERMPQAATEQASAAQAPANEPTSAEPVPSQVPATGRNWWPESVAAGASTSSPTALIRRAPTRPVNSQASRRSHLPSRKPSSRSRMRHRSSPTYRKS